MIKINRVSRSICIGVFYILIILLFAFYYKSLGDQGVENHFSFSEQLSFEKNISIYDELLPNSIEDRDVLTDLFSKSDDEGFINIAADGKVFIFKAKGKAIMDYYSFKFLQDGYTHFSFSLVEKLNNIFIYEFRLFKLNNESSRHVYNVKKLSDNYFNSNNKKITKSINNLITDAAFIYYMLEQPDISSFFLVEDSEMDYNPNTTVFPISYMLSTIAKSTTNIIGEDDYTIGGITDSDYPIGHYLYFSIVTITSLGYGDIVPLSLEVRNAVSLEVVLGILTMGLFLGQLFYDDKKEEIIDQQ